MQEKLLQGECKQLKGTKNFLSVLYGFLSVKNASKLSVKYLEDKLYKIKQIQNIPITLRTFSAKNLLEKFNSKEDSSKTPISKVLGKIPNMKRTSKQQYNFFKDIEVHGMSYEDKFLRGSKFQGKNTAFL